LLCEAGNIGNETCSGTDDFIVPDYKISKSSALKLTVEQAEAVMRISHNPDFKQVMEALNAYRLEAIEFCLYGPGEAADINRGIARGVTEIMRGIGKADNIVKPRG